MPTGYTSELTETTPLAVFAMKCARGMGALIMMRDDPLDAPVPESFPVSEYSVRSVVDAEAALAAHEALTDEQREAHAAARFESEKRDREEKRAKNKVQRAIYERMLAMVHAWNPPTADHVGMKTFMVEQLTSSIKGDCWSEKDLARYYPPPVKQTSEQWWRVEFDSLVEALDRARKHLREDEERTARRNGWLSALRASLPAVPPSTKAGEP